jgi:hypothetical protein
MIAASLRFLREMLPSDHPQRQTGVIMMFSLATAKLAILAVANLVGSSKTAKDLIGEAPPLQNMLEIAFSHYDTISRRRLRQMSGRITSELKKRTNLDDGTSRAIYLHAEKMLGHYGLTDQEFAGLGLNSAAAADRILTHRSFSNKGDRLEMEAEVRNVLIAVYEGIRLDPELFQGLLPHICAKLASDFEEVKRYLHWEHAKQRMGPQQPKEFGMARLDFQDYYIAKCPASLKEYDAMAELARAQFVAPGELIDLVEDRKAFQRNPYSMVVLLNRKGDVIGFVDIYHLPDEKLDTFLFDTEGTASIDPNDCLDYEVARQAKRAYIATILVKEEKGICVARRSAALVYGMCEFLLKHQFHGTDTLELWAIASTEEGESFIEHLPFSYDHLVRWQPEPSWETKRAFKIQLEKTALAQTQAKFFADYDLRNVHLCIDDYRQPSA